MTKKEIEKVANDYADKVSGNCSDYEKAKHGFIDGVMLCQKIIETANRCASYYFIKEWRDKLPNAMAELDLHLKEFYKKL